MPQAFFTGNEHSVNFGYYVAEDELLVDDDKDDFSRYSYTEWRDNQ